MTDPRNWTSYEHDNYLEEKKLVDSTAYPSDLPSWTSERINIAHFNHGRRKIRVKSGTASTIFRNNTVRRPSAEEDLIWCKETLLLNQILEVIVVKRIWCHQVECCQISVATRRRTPAPTSASKASINVTPIVVYPVSKCDALSLTNCVGACIWTILIQDLGIWP